MLGAASILLTVFSACGDSSAAPPPPKILTSVTILPASPSVTVSATVQLNATAHYSDGSTNDVTISAGWSSSDTTKATVQSNGASAGLGTGVAAGTSTISATFKGISGQVILTINAHTKTLTNLTISPLNPAIAVTATQQFIATATFQGGSTSDVTSSANWSSSDNAEATIQTTGDGSPGLATAISPGSPNIDATYQGITALTILDVTCPVSQQTGIQLSEVIPSIAPGATLQFVAVVHCSNGSSQKITTAANWNSSNKAVATIGTGASNPGLVTGIGAGTTMITASYNNGSTTFSSAPTTVTVTSSAMTVPLTDMTISGQNYLGFKGGLYGNNSNSVPAGHATDGKAAAGAIQPRLQDGTASSKGAVVFLGIGMSNATIEFSNFINAATADPNVNHTTLAIEDGAHGAVTACPWTVAFSPPYPDTVCGIASGTVSAENQYDRVRDGVLATAVGVPSAPAGCGGPPNPVPCLTEKQVQVLWIKNANPDPGLNGVGSLSASTNCASELPKPTTEACLYEQQLGETVRAARSRYPNLEQIFLSTRIYAGYATTALNPEPYAYQYGFSGQWLVLAQINQIAKGATDPVAGNLDYKNGTTAWTTWGPYLWANGTTPRSDGLIWCNAQASAPCNGEQDFEPDGTHPSAINPGHDGATKVVNQLMNFFKTSAFTCAWFQKAGTVCP